MTRYNRRDFLRIGGLTTLALAGSSAVRAPQALASGLLGSLKIYRRTKLMMGTYVTITLVDDSNIKSAEAVEAAFGEMARLEMILSRFNADGPLVHLARTGSLSSPDPALVKVLKAADQIYRASHANFDVTVAPVIDIIKNFFAATGKAPDKAILAEKMQLVDGKAMNVTPSRISLEKAGMAITLDGLAKGYIVDQAGRVLKAHGIKQGLINAGGDILALGKKGSKPWRVAITDPTRQDGSGPIISLSNEAIATSGNYEIYWDEEKLHHHIVSPDSGMSVAGPVSASVRSNNCLSADALSTTVFCMGADEGFKLLASQKAKGLIINKLGSKKELGRWS